jgi:signal transduction histidine kinase/CheY-like chemotaxis protein
MRTKFIERIVSWPETILRNGIREDTAPEAEKNILRLNLLLVFGLSICLINLLLSVSNQLMFSTSVNLLGCISLITSYYMNKYGKYFRAKVLGIIAINLYLLGINYVEGLRSGQYLFFFPLVLALIFVIDLKKNVNELILTGVLTLATTAFIFILAPYQNTSLQDIPQSLYSRLFSSNLAISLLLSSLFSYLILKTIEAREHRIIEEKNFAETIYDTSLEAVIIVKMDDLMITNCNRRALDIFKYGNKHDLISKPVQVVLGEELLDLLKDITDSGVTKGSPWYGNMDFNDSDNGIFYGFVNIVPFAHLDEHFCKISILDITETRLAEFEILQAKERAEKAAMVKARFLSNMSHELRTPLNGIIGTTNILLQEEYLDTQRESLDVLKHASEHMLQLVNDILDLSKLEAGKMELEEKPFNLKEFMQRVAAPFIRSANRNISFVLDVDHDLDIDIISDQTRLQQVLNNLISNANKFTPEGTITIGAKMEQRNSQQVSITFSVSDTGIGILPARQQQIFDSFTQADAETTRKYGGTGLGLSISRHIVEKMGGELEVDSYPGIGSTFFFTIQLRFNSTKAFVNETTLKQLTEMEGNRILLAEDNPMNMMVATRFLKKWKMQVDEACNGLEALELYGKNSYDLLLVDLEMPEMDGVSFVAHVRKTGDDIPIIAFTAAVYDNMHEDLKQKGFSDFITKPFRPEDLHKRILQLTAWSPQLQAKCG